MTSICNYSHPQNQITTNLTRQGHGALFPYNPEFYDLASGLYGPGAFVCWQLLLLSVILNWAFHVKGRSDGIRRPGVSVDLLGLLAYPAFAATDAAVQALKFLGTPHRALAVFCLRYPIVHLEGFSVAFNTTKLDLREPVPADVLYLGQRAVNLTGPLDVCYMFLAASHVRIFCNVFRDHIGLEPTEWAGWLTSGTYIYVVITLWIVHLSLGDVGTSMILWLYETTFPFMFVGLLCGFLMIAAVFASFVLFFVLGLTRRDRTLLLDSLKTLGGFLVLAVFLGGPVMTLLVLDRETSFIPDMGISVAERDQLAALVVGIATLLYTIYEIWRRWKKKKEENSNDVELQPLAHDEE